MNLEDAKQIVQRVVNVFETGTPTGKYDALVIYKDGKNGSRQITFGRSQTTEQGNLKTLLYLYIQQNGKYAADLQPYLEKVGKISLVDDPAFKNLLIKAAADDTVMRATQDSFFDKLYYNPAIEFCTMNGLALPLSLLVVYDSYIHSGGVPRFLRKRFGEFPPASGGDEKRWTTSYVDVRHQWLKYHSNPLLQKTIYRTQCFKDQIAIDNWDLDKLPIMANGVAV
ncbi:MAG: chitosanase [Ignavibacteriales bacterium]|nr:chitosanase [Ignavibacteriales bacterium]